MQRRLHKQRRVNTCAVASLRTVLDLQLGLKVAEEALEAHATEAHAPILRYGTSAAQLRAMVQGVNRTHNTSKKRWTLRMRRMGTLEALEQELLQGRFPLTRMYQPNTSSDYHMVVVLRVAGGRVCIWDPDPTESAHPRWLPEMEFVSWWAGDGDSAWYAVLGGGDAATGRSTRSARRGVGGRGGRGVGGSDQAAP